ncbi:hypothetical protein HY087_00145 [Candidatus Gottesmanbacteria bacterium]|nr:hypothetical protein [Candidatus Gottesmanbacteria bacterium]
METGYLDKIRDYIIWLRTGSGTIVFLATFIGACQVLKKRAFFTNLFMGFTLCFLLFIALAKAHWDNYILPILPITSLFAAVVLYTLYQGAVAYSHTKLFGLFLVGLLLYPATTKAVWIARSYSRPDTRSQEIQWFKDHHIESNRIARDGHTSIDVPSDTVLLSKLTHDQLKNFDYIVLSGWYSPNFANPKRNTPGLAQWYADLKRTYTKVAEFMPSDDMIFRDDIQVATIWNWWKQPPPVRGPQISIYAININ